MRDSEAPMTLGAEEEFFVVDVESRELAGSNPLMEVAGQRFGSSVTPELNLCQIEIASKVCSGLDELGADLRRLRQGLAEAGAPLGLGIAAAGTHPFSPWGDQEVNRQHDRYAQMEHRFQIVARQQVICGCHIHIGFDDPELAVATMNRARPWLPILLALSANSPFWSGHDTGFQSYRTEVWQRWPTAGFGPVLESRAHFDEIIAELQAIEAIEDGTHLYWYMRPSSRYPTVEFRICDVPLLEEDTVTLAGLVRALAWSCRRDALCDRPLPRRDTQTLEAAMWQAARHGVRGKLVDPARPRLAPAIELVEQLLDFVADGLEAHGDQSTVRRAVAAILERGTGADLQLAVFAGAGTMEAVVDAIVARTANAAPTEPRVGAHAR